MHLTNTTYKDVYSTDLQEQHGLNSNTLLITMAISTLLNLVLGIVSKILRSKLITNE